MAQDPTAIAAKWANGLANSTQAITDGINGVTVAPGAAAARQKQAYVSGVQASADKWATNVAKVTLSDWQQAMTTKAIPRIASGAQAAQPKFAAFMTQLLPQIATAKAALPPRGTLQQNLARMNQFVTAMSNVKINK